MPRPASVNSKPRAAHSFTGSGIPRQDCLDGPYQVEDMDCPAQSPSLGLCSPLEEGPPKRRLCASTARAEDVQVPLMSPNPASPEAVIASLPAVPRLGADLDPSRVPHRAPPASSALRMAKCFLLWTHDGTVLTLPLSRTNPLTTLGGDFGLPHPAGALGVCCKSSSPIQSRPFRRRRPTPRIARDFSVCLATSCTFTSAEAAVAAARRGEGGTLVSWKDIRASRKGNRTGGSGSCHSVGPGPGIDRPRCSKPLPLTGETGNLAWGSTPASACI
mmetsp:Transcript_17645/g.39951  ORF Transcript_17645/g.39951 Transcript_17645/m.39951 type:complete len:274 (+) Transcript_17645:275-1096(+)